jgi:hypothetical protein
MATLIGSDEFKNYRPSFAGVDPNKKVNVAGYMCLSTVINNHLKLGYK